MQAIKLPLSSSVNGKSILVTATTSASANNVHTAINNSSNSASLDEVWLYAYNEGTASVTSSILFGGTTEPGDVIRAIVNPKSRILIIDGLVLNGGLTVQSYASVASLISISGFINRIQ